jgi:hypothetical protein
VAVEPISFLGSLVGEIMAKAKPNRQENRTSKLFLTTPSAGLHHAITCAIMMAWCELRCN